MEHSIYKESGLRENLKGRVVDNPKAYKDKLSLHLKDKLKVSVQEIWIGFFKRPNQELNFYRVKFIRLIMVEIPGWEKRIIRYKSKSVNGYRKTTGEKVSSKS